MFSTLGIGGNVNSFRADVQTQQIGIQGEDNNIRAEDNRINDMIRDEAIREADYAGTLTPEQIRAIGKDKKQ